MKGCRRPNLTLGKRMIPRKKNHGLYWVKGLGFRVILNRDYIGNILGLYGDNGKENGN